VADVVKPDKTVAEGWDEYARRRLTKSRVGDRWNNPRIIGMDVDNPEDVVPYLDRTVIGPFFGTCQVLLEIGPGGGRFTDVLLPRCQRLIAVDTSANMLELLQQRFAGDQRLELQLGDGQGLQQVADESVDGAFSYGVFVHLQHWDIYNYLVELHRVLRPGGKALIQHSNTFSELGWQKFRRDVKRQLNRHKLPSSFVVNSPELMREFILRAGLQVVELNVSAARRDCISLMLKPT
jgi:SAM-dependent methyltransferase